MWSNISAPKSHLKAAQVGCQANGPSPTGSVSVSSNNSSPSTTSSSSSRRPHNCSSPLMRYKHAVCASRRTGFIYIHGGRFGNGLQLDDDVWRFDPHENMWLQLHTTGIKPPSLQEHTLIEHNNCLYLFGGQVSAVSGQENSFWRLNLSTNEWSSLNMRSSMRHGAYLGPTNRRGHSAVVHRQSMYIFGGYEDFRGSSSQLWQFDLLNERWELRNLSSSSACHPEPRHGHSAIVYQDSMYVYGGLSNLKPLGDLWRWSWRDKRWFRERTRGQSPGCLHGHTAVQAFGSMFVFGGERQNGRTTRSLWRLNLQNLSWLKIRPKGPRPNPTTWHVAVANPMDILNEANYLIEGNNSEEVDDEADERSFVHCQPVASMSDNCFLQQQAKYHDEPKTMQQQQIIPMEIIRPKEQNGNNHLSTLLEEQLTSGKAKTRRKLRLNFLKRTSNKQKQREQMRRQMPSSWSAANLINVSHPDVDKVAEVTTTNGQQKEEIVMMTEHDVEQQNAKILDSLDTDIKQMFQHSDALGPPESDSINYLNETTNQASIKQENNRVEMGDKERVCDSSTQSQLSSYTQANDGASSRLTLTSQTYRTAQEQIDLASQSTLTITNDTNSKNRENLQHRLSSNSDDLVGQNRQEATTSRLGEIKQRRSMHLINQRRSNYGHTTSGEAQRRARPKSEILQSLIDRADARIKHLYTPLFQPDPHIQSQTSALRAQRAGGSALLDQSRVAAGPGAYKWTNLVDRTKRHTIHQTTTYYNLYYNGIENDNDNENEPILRSNGTRDEAASQDHSSATSTTSTLKNTNGGGAALIGVRDGSNGDSNSTTPKGQETDATSLSSSLFGSSSHQTLKAEPILNNNNNNNNNKCEGPDRHSNGHLNEHARKCAPMDDDDDADGDEAKKQQLDLASDRELQSEMSADNTSMSFSVIAEFEEDDMLQYSSPTDPNLILRSNQGIYSNDSINYENDSASYSSDNQRLGVANISGNQDRHTIEEAEHENNNKSVAYCEQSTVKQQKSTSSGYDSVRSSSGNTYDDNNNNNHNVYDQTQTQTTNSKTTTVDSLQALTQSSGCSVMNSPPSKSLAIMSSSSAESDSLRGSAALVRQNQQQRAHQTAANRLASKLGFGRRRTTKTRYWQLCMFVMGGKQQPSCQTGGGPGDSLSEPINIWRLYI